MMSRSAQAGTTALLGVVAGVAIYATIARIRSDSVPAVLIPDVYDVSFHSVPPDMPIVLVFRVENRSRDSITLESIQAGCQCADVKTRIPLPANLEPGKSIECSVRLTPRPALTAQSLNIVATCVDRDENKFELAGVAKYLSHPPLRAEPPVITLGVVAPASGIIEQEIRILRASEHSVELRALHFEGVPGVSVEAQAEAAEPTAPADYLALCKLRVRIDPRASAHSA